MARRRRCESSSRRSWRWRRRAEVERFFRDLCTLAELEAMAHRWEVARLLEQGLPYLEIAQRTGASTTTVTRVAHWLRHGEGGYRLALDRKRRLPDDRRSGQGAAARAVVRCSRTQGSGPSSPASARSPSRAATRRSTCCSCAPPTSRSTCRTASSTAGSPASTSSASAARAVDELLRARLRLAAGSRRPCRRSRRYEPLEDLAGASVATVYPRLTRELLPVEVELVDVTGSVEIAPRLGLADAIVDLVSSGNTLRTNGLRSLGVLLESEAVLIARDEEAAAPFVAMMRAVVEARAHRYLMLNAPAASRSTAICAIVGSRSPSVLPLAEAGHGRGARARAVGRRLAAAARARGGRRARRSWSSPSSG